MTYTEQIEQYVALFPEATAVSVPMFTGIVDLPAYPEVEVNPWDADFCELESASSEILARFRLVG